MQQKHVFWAKYFSLFVFGHFFCPFLTFPKYFQSKKHDILGSLSTQVIIYITIAPWAGVNDR
jgi:hypothetical protein